MVKSDILLEVSGLRVRHGRVPALSDIDIELRKGEAVGLLGANGAGKTTLLNALSGFLPHESGKVILFGETLRWARRTGSPAPACCRFRRTATCSRT
ncbi:ATP-binding cassette domain-containing protein [Achromobacter xylosoxidans]